MWILLIQFLLCQVSFLLPAHMMFGQFSLSCGRQLVFAMYLTKLATLSPEEQLSHAAVRTGRREMHDLGPKFSTGGFALVLQTKAKLLWGDGSFESVGPRMVKDVGAPLMLVIIIDRLLGIGIALLSRRG